MKKEILVMENIYDAEEIKKLWEAGITAPENPKYNIYFTDETGDVWESLVEEIPTSINDLSIHQIFRSGVEIEFLIDDDNYIETIFVDEH